MYVNPARHATPRSRRRLRGMETLVLIALIALAAVVVTACVAAFG